MTNKQQAAPKNVLRKIPNAKSSNENRVKVIKHFQPGVHHSEVCHAHTDLPEINCNVDNHSLQQNTKKTHATSVAGKERKLKTVVGCSSRNRGKIDKTIEEKVAKSESKFLRESAAVLKLKDIQYSGGSSSNSLVKNRGPTKKRSSSSSTFRFRDHDVIKLYNPFLSVKSKSFTGRKKHVEKIVRTRNGKIVHSSSSSSEVEQKHPYRLKRQVSSHKCKTVRDIGGDAVESPQNKLKIRKEKIESLRAEIDRLISLSAATRKRNVIELKTEIAEFKRSSKDVLSVYNVQNNQHQQAKSERIFREGDIVPQVDIPDKVKSTRENATTDSIEEARSSIQPLGERENKEIPSEIASSTSVSVEVGKGLQRGIKNDLTDKCWSNSDPSSQEEYIKLKINEAKAVMVRVKGTLLDIRKKIIKSKTEEDIADDTDKDFEPITDMAVPLLEFPRCNTQPEYSNEAISYERPKTRRCWTPESPKEVDGANKFQTSPFDLVDESIVKNTKSMEELQAKLNTICEQSESDPSSRAEHKISTNVQIADVESKGVLTTCAGCNTEPFFLNSQGTQVQPEISFSATQISHGTTACTTQTSPVKKQLTIQHILGPEIAPKTLSVFNQLSVQVMPVVDIKGGLVLQKVTSYYIDESGVTHNLIRGGLNNVGFSEVSARDQIKQPKTNFEDSSVDKKANPYRAINVLPEISDEEHFKKKGDPNRTFNILKAEGAKRECPETKYDLCSEVYNNNTVLNGSKRKDNSDSYSSPNILQEISSETFTGLDSRSDIKQEMCSKGEKAPSILQKMDTRAKCSEKKLGPDNLFDMMQEMRNTEKRFERKVDSNNVKDIMHEKKLNPRSVSHMLQKRTNKEECSERIASSNSKFNKMEHINYEEGCFEEEVGPCSASNMLLKRGNEKEYFKKKSNPNSAYNMMQKGNCMEKHFERVACPCSTSIKVPKMSNKEEQSEKIAVSDSDPSEVMQEISYKEQCFERRTCPCIASIILQKMSTKELFEKTVGPDNASNLTQEISYNGEHFERRNCPCIASIILKKMSNNNECPKRKVCPDGITVLAQEKNNKIKCLERKANPHNTANTLEKITNKEERSEKKVGPDSNSYIKHVITNKVECFEKKFDHLHATNMLQKISNREECSERKVVPHSASKKLEEMSNKEKRAGRTVDSDNKESFERITDPKQTCNKPTMSPSFNDGSLGSGFKMNKSISDPDFYSKLALMDELASSESGANGNTVVKETALPSIQVYKNPEYHEPGLPSETTIDGSCHMNMSVKTVFFNSEGMPNKDSAVSVSHMTTSRAKETPVEVSLQKDSNEIIMEIHDPCQLDEGITGVDSLKLHKTNINTDGNPNKLDLFALSTNPKSCKNEEQPVADFNENPVKEPVIQDTFSKLWDIGLYSSKGTQCDIFVDCTMKASMSCDQRKEQEAIPIKGKSRSTPTHTSHSSSLDKVSLTVSYSTEESTNKSVSTESSHNQKPDVISAFAEKELVIIEPAAEYELTQSLLEKRSCLIKSTEKQTKNSNTHNIMVTPEVQSKIKLFRENLRSQSGGQQTEDLSSGEKAAKNVSISSTSPVFMSNLNAGKSKDLQKVIPDVRKYMKKPNRNHFTTMPIQIHGDCIPMNNCYTLKTQPSMELEGDGKFNRETNALFQNYPNYKKFSDSSVKRRMLRQHSIPHNFIKKYTLDSSSDSVTRDESISEGEIRCLCSVSLGEVHNCRSHHHSVRGVPVTRQKNIDADLKLTVTDKKMHFDNWVTYYVSNKSTAVNESASSSSKH